MMATNWAVGRASHDGPTAQFVDDCSGIDIALALQDPACTLGELQASRPEAHIRAVQRQRAGVTQKEV